MFANPVYIEKRSLLLVFGQYALIYTTCQQCLRDLTEIATVTAFLWQKLEQRGIFKKRLSLPEIEPTI